MTTRPGKRDESGRPLPALLTQARDITTALLHQRLTEEGFEGVRYRHGSVFRFIEPDGSRLTVLAERSGLSKQAIGGLVDELARLDYVERTTDPVDRRAKIIRLTARGVQAQVAAGRILRQIERRWVRQFGQFEIAELRRILEKIIALQGR
jgi:DNA-binding MarR family transcriptional regulator